ncbi:Carbon monoxide dehydrogenase medium chain [Actinokineospora spheciospongiae]|uniref:Carbon monoxide dehydrogenase medium chain n=1 Tax=Actinokineospora spheciospongiae TaxID=909613 RepID=W7IU53_9PSEU|nr:Carbon monoxide dehydrogenase medium chain [Actinokineospora spheciospongiae]
MRMLQRRLVRPTLLVDVGCLSRMREVVEEPDHLVIGATTTQHELLHDARVRAHAPLLSLVARHVGDPAVRHRGTLGGSVAHADPAGDPPAAVLALDGEIIVEGPRGERVIPSAEFFVGPFRTALEPDELLVGVRVPKMGEGWTVHYEKFRLSAQKPTLLGVAVMVRRVGDCFTDAHIALANSGSTPVRATAVEVALVGADVTEEAVTKAADLLDGTMEPFARQGVSQAYLAHLARVLTRRAVVAALSW